MSRAIRMLLLVWLLLAGLLALTVTMAFVPLGGMSTVIAYAIATAKAALVLWFFMEMRREESLVRLGAAAGFVWLTMLFVLMAADFGSRY